MAHKRILVVDDERLTRISLADFLEEEGYETMTAADGESALQLQRLYRFESCIVDIRMPGIDGIEVIQRLHEIAPESVYIIYTGSPQFTVPPVLKALGVQQRNVVFKPISDMSVFIPLIEQAFHAIDQNEVAVLDNGDLPVHGGCRA